MVIIPLSPSLASLAITIISVIAELLCLSALLTFNNLMECSTLSRGRLVSIRRHRNRILLMTLIAMIIFVTVEILTSTFSSTDFAEVAENVPCLRTVTPGTKGATTIGAEILLFSCLVISGNTFTFFGGNYSSSLGRTSCSDEFLFRYENQVFGNGTVSDGGVRRCETPLLSSTCTIVRAQGRTVLISEPFQKPPADKNEKEVSWLFLRTEVNFDPEPLLDLLSNKSLEAHLVPAVEEWDIRRRVFMGLESSTCIFKSKGKEQTKIGAAITIVTSCLWILSVMLFCFSLFFKHNSFYNISNPLHWANKTYRAVGNEESSVTHVRCVLEDRSRKVYATDASGSQAYVPEGNNSHIRW